MKYIKKMKTLGVSSQVWAMGNLVNICIKTSYNCTNHYLYQVYVVWFDWKFLKKSIYFSFMSKVFYNLFFNCKS
jgi:hypothetical protein